MTTLGQMQRPEANQFDGKRKLFLVPNFLFPPDVPSDVKGLLERYWSEVRDHVQNLERSLGSISHVYHETLYASGDEGIQLLEAMNPLGSSFIQAICQSDASLEETEDRALVEENIDWQRCISIGLSSEKVMTLAMEGYQETTQKRFEHIGTQINDTLKENEAGILFIREDHRVQFPTDIQVFYVAPPALDALKRWLSDQMRAFTQPQQEAEGVSE